MVMIIRMMAPIQLVGMMMMMMMMLLLLLLSKAVLLSALLLRAAAHLAFSWWVVSRVLCLSL